MKNIVFIIVFVFAFTLPLEAALFRPLKEKMMYLARKKNIQGLNEIVEQLIESGFVNKIGRDHKMRPLFVTTQAIVEQAIADLMREKKIISFKGAIHTPLPATPLCTEGQKDFLIAKQEVLEHPHRYQTIPARAKSVRDILKQNGFFYIIYSKTGLSRRSAKQRKIFLRTCALYSKYLINRPIERFIIDNYIGATYVFVDVEKMMYLFSIKATQAVDARDHMQWSLWLDKVKVPTANKRLRFINRFLIKKANCDLYTFHFKNWVQELPQLENDLSLG